MSNMHRIQWFDQQVRAALYPNSNDLAQRFEISKRQAQRDIEYMDISLRAPLVYIARHRGYAYKDMAYVLPHLYMTEEEKRMLKFLVHRYRQYNYDNAEAAHRIAYLLDRFTDEEETKIYSRLPAFDANPRQMQIVLLLAGAIKESRAVDIVYESERHRILPLRLVSRYNTDYVAACCERRSEERMFRLEAIEEALVTDQSFDRADPGAPIPEEGMQPVRRPFTAKVRLHGPLPAGTWNGFPARPAEDRHVYTVEFHDTAAFLQHLLTAEWSELQSPKWLKRKLRTKCKAVMEQLGPEEDS